MGQMLRGGRSSPSERKIGAGDEMSGNLTEGGSGGDGSDATSLTKGVAEQEAEHRLHRSDAGCPRPSS